MDGVETFELPVPKFEDYELLYRYQQQTPASYVAVKPRLHAFAQDATVKFVPSQSPEYTAFVPLTLRDPNDDDGAPNDAESDAPPPQADGFIHCTGIDVWVTSEYEIKQAPAC